MRNRTCAKLQMEFRFCLNDAILAQNLNDSSFLLPAISDSFKFDPWNPLARGVYRLSQRARSRSLGGTCCKSCPSTCSCRCVGSCREMPRPPQSWLGFVMNCHGLMSCLLCTTMPALNVTSWNLTRGHAFDKEPFSHLARNTGIRLHMPF